MKKKILLLTLILSILLSILAVGAYASPEPEHTGVAEWEISDDGNMLTRYEGELEISYLRVHILSGKFTLENRLYYFSGSLSFNDDYYSIISSSHDSGIVYLRSAYTDEVIPFVNGGSKDLLRFINGDFKKARMLYEESAVSVTREFVDKLDALRTDSITCGVKSLKDVPIAEIKIYDDEDILTHLHGAIYILESAPYYVNYDALGNQYFDSNGDFSYVKGTVTLYPIKGDVLSEYESLLGDMEYYSHDISFEDDFSFIGGDDNIFDLSDESARALLIVLVLLLGFAAPAVPFVILLLELIGKKAKHVFVTYVAFIASAIWMTMGIMMFVLILIL